MLLAFILTISLYAVMFHAVDQPLTLITQTAVVYLMVTERRAKLVHVAYNSIESNGQTSREQTA